MPTTLPRTRSTVMPWADRRVTGTPDRVATAVNQQTEQGRLISMSAPVRLADGRVSVLIRVRTSDPSAVYTDHARPARPHTLEPAWRQVVKAALAGTAIASVALCLVCLAAMWLASALTWLLPLVVGGLVVIALLALLMRSSGGHHCPGCRH